MQLTSNVDISVSVEGFDGGFLEAVGAEHLVDAFDVVFVMRTPRFAVPASAHDNRLWVGPRNFEIRVERANTCTFTANECVIAEFYCIQKKDEPGRRFRKDGIWC